MSWCDKLASTPAMGLTLDWQFLSGSDLLDALAPIMDGYVGPAGPKFNVDRLEAHAAGFATEDGFSYQVEPSKIFVTFQHRIRAKPVSGGLPVMEMMSHAAPYTQLLPNVAERLADATLLIPSNKGRKISKVGVVSTTVVAEDQLPPGIAQFAEYIGRPWQSKIEEYNISITSELGSSAAGTDKCIHTITKKQNDENLVTLIFDWQRWFGDKKVISKQVIKDILGNAEKSALNYFEEIAEGSIFDEELIRGSVVSTDDATVNVSVGTSP